MQLNYKRYRSFMQGQRTFVSQYILYFSVQTIIAGFLAACYGIRSNTGIEECSVNGKNTGVGADMQDIMYICFLVHAVFFVYTAFLGPFFEVSVIANTSKSSIQEQAFQSIIGQISVTVEMVIRVAIAITFVWQEFFLRKNTNWHCKNESIIEQRKWMNVLHWLQLTNILFTYWRFQLKSLKGYCDELRAEFDPFYQAETGATGGLRDSGKQTSGKSHNIDHIAQTLNMHPERLVNKRSP